MLYTRDGKTQRLQRDLNTIQAWCDIGLPPINSGTKYLFLSGNQEIAAWSCKPVGIYSFQEIYPGQRVINAWLLACPCVQIVKGLSSRMRFIQQLNVCPHQGKVILLHQSPSLPPSVDTRELQSTIQQSILTTRIDLYSFSFPTPCTRSLLSNMSHFSEKEELRKDN